MAYRFVLNDEQRLSLLEGWGDTFEAEPLKSDATAQEIRAELTQGATDLQALLAFDTQHSQMEGLDLLLDSCFQGLDSACEAVEKKAFVTGHFEVEEEASSIRKILFPRGLKGIIRLPYAAESAECQAFLLRSEIPSARDFLQRHGLEDWISLIRTHLQTYIHGMETFREGRADRKTLVEAAEIGRRSIDLALLRLRTYLRSKYPDGHPQASWRLRAIEHPLERAVSAVSALQALRRKQKSSSPPSPPSA